MDDPGPVVDLDGEQLLIIGPGQKYAATFPIAGFTTCVRCGAVVDEQLLDVHDRQAHT